MKSKALELLLMTGMMGGGLPNIQIPVKKNFGKPLEAHRIAPRSMTTEEKEYYDRNKHLDRFYR